MLPTTRLPQTIIQKSTSTVLPYYLLLWSIIKIHQQTKTNKMRTTRSHRLSFATPKEIMVTPIYMGRKQRSQQQQQPEDDEPLSPVNNNRKRRSSLYPSFKENSSIVQNLERLERIQAMWGINSNMIPTISAEEDLIDQDVDDLVVNFMYIPPTTTRRGSSSSSSSSSSRRTTQVA